MNNNDDLKGFLLIFVGLPAAYAAFRLLPYFVFYAVPCLVIAFLACKIWLYGCHYKHTNYQRVAFFLPLTLVLLVITVGFPTPVTSKIESPLWHGAFNYFNEGIEAFINSTWLTYFRRLLPGIPPLRYEPVAYDLRDLAWSVWIGTVVGAPAAFLVWATEDDQERILTLTKNYEEKLKTANHESYELRRDLYDERTRSKKIIAAKEEELTKLQAVADELKKSVPLLPPPAQADGTQTVQAPEPETNATGIFASNTL